MSALWLRGLPKAVCRNQLEDWPHLYLMRCRPGVSISGDACTVVGSSHDDDEMMSRVMILEGRLRESAFGQVVYVVLTIRKVWDVLPQQQAMLGDVSC